LKSDLSRRQFIMTAVGVAFGLTGYPSFLPAADEVDRAVMSGESAAATKKALAVLGEWRASSKKGSARSSNRTCRLPKRPIWPQQPTPRLSRRWRGPASKPGTGRVWSWIIRGIGRSSAWTGRVSGMRAGISRVSTSWRSRTGNSSARFASPGLQGFL